MQKFFVQSLSTHFQHRMNNEIQANADKSDSRQQLQRNRIRNDAVFPLFMRFSEVGDSLPKVAYL